MTFAGIFHLIAKGMPEATSNAGLRAQLPEDGRRATDTPRRPAGARARRPTFLSGIPPGLYGTAANATRQTLFDSQYL